MSVKNKIREMVMALVRGDHAEAQNLFSEVSAAKSKEIVESFYEDELDEASPLGRASRRHARAGRRFANAKKNMAHDMTNRTDESRRDDDDQDFSEFGMQNKRKTRDRGRPRKMLKRKHRTDEMNDTGSDSGVMKGQHDSNDEDNTKAKGKVRGSASMSGKFDSNHEDNTRAKGHVTGSASMSGKLDNNHNELDEKWNNSYETPESKKGMFDGKTLADLKKQYAALKKSGPHKKGSDAYTKMRELNFAIRAKEGWPHHTH